MFIYTAVRVKATAAGDNEARPRCRRAGLGERRSVYNSIARR